MCSNEGAGAAGATALTSCGAATIGAEGSDRGDWERDERNLDGTKACRAPPTNDARRGRTLPRWLSASRASMAASRALAMFAALALSRGGASLLPVHPRKAPNM